MLIEAEFYNLVEFEICSLGEMAYTIASKAILARDTGSTPVGSTSRVLDMNSTERKVGTHSSLMNKSSR